jgi:peptidyl-dipeptidase Dcp
MKNITSILLMSALGFSISCSTMKENTTKIDDTAVLNNPFYKKSTLQYQAPEFDKIKDEHFAPAFDNR